MFLNSVVSRDFRCGKWTKLWSFNWFSHNWALTSKALILSYLSAVSLSLHCSSLWRLFKWPVTATRSPRSVIRSLSFTSSILLPFFSTNNLTLFNKQKMFSKQTPEITAYISMMNYFHLKITAVSNFSLCPSMFKCNRHSRYSIEV